MADKGPLAVHFEYRFDRHLADRLASADERLAPVRQVFDWYMQDPCSVGEVARRLIRQGIRTRTGTRRWHPWMIWGMQTHESFDRQSPGNVVVLAYTVAKAGRGCHVDCRWVPR